MKNSMIYAYKPYCRRDRARVLKVLKHATNPSFLWKKIPDIWFSDKDFLLEFFKVCPYGKLPARTKLFQSSSVRGDRDILLALCQRSDFEILYFDENLTLSETLVDDKDVMIALCSKIPQCLQNASNRLRDDTDVVEAAVSKSGWALQYASLRFKQDKEMVILACKTYPRAFELCPVMSNTYFELSRDREFFLSVLLNRPGSGNLVKYAKQSLQEDPAVVLKAIQHGLSIHQFVHRPVTINFVKDALRVCPKLYLEISPDIRERYPFLLKYAISKPAISVEEELQILKCGKDYLMDFVESSEATEPYQGLVYNGKNIWMPFCDDQEVMLPAIARDYRFFNVASMRLRKSPEIILAAMTPISVNRIFSNVSRAIRRQHPKLSIEAIRCWPSDLLDDLPAKIPFEHWSNLDVCKGLVQRGWVIRKDWFRSHLGNDKTFGLELAKYNPFYISHVGEELLSDPDFIMKALEIDGRIIKFIGSSLQKDFEVMLMAVASYYNNQGNDVHSERRWGENSSIHKFLFNAGIAWKQVRAFHIQVNELVQLYDTFVMDVMPAISFSPDWHGREETSPLTLLNLGSETAEALKRLIAEFLGIPIGTRLKLFLKAHATMAYRLPEKVFGDL